MRIALAKIPTRWIAAVTVVFTVAALHFGGALAPLDRALMDLRFRVLQRPATGELVLVQIDARSLRALDTWPWPRRYHGELLDRLMSAGVREVAWDVDFSAHSTAADDRLFAASLARAGDRVILPAFRQAASPEAVGQGVTDTLPKPIFRQRAQIGGINVSPSGDGLIRSIADAAMIDGQRLPSVFALLAGPSAIRGRRFLIDFGIDPQTIPRVSYIDVLRGTVDTERLAGKVVLVGASAAELGDILPVPIYRSMSGAGVQAMAYESIVQDRALRLLGPVAMLPAGAVLLLVLVPLFTTWPWRAAIAVGVLAMIGVELAAIGIQAAAPVVLSSAPLLLTVAISFAVAMARRADVQTRRLHAQRTAIEKRRMLMDRMVEDSFDGIVIADRDGKVRVLNRAAERMLGRAARQSIGRPLASVLCVVPDSATQASPWWQGASEHGGPFECKAARAGGGEIDIEMVVGHVALPDGRGGQETFHTFTFRDIEERKRAQEAAQRARDEAVSANRAKTEFLANMSHELRTPLNAIIGFSEVIQNQLFGPINPPRYLQYVGDIAASGTHLLEIINDILDVSRVELGRVKLDKAELDTCALLRSCVRIAAGWPAFAERGFTAEIPDTLPAILGDERIVKQVMINLLSNAFKYSLPGDNVALSARVGEEGEIAVSVRDSGIGIAAEHIPKLTTPFYQVDGSLARRHEGTGLGLFLSASHVELHGGKMHIESAPGVGTTVTVRLPAAAAEISAASA